MSARNQWDLRCPGCGRDDEIDIAATGLGPAVP